MGVNRSLTAILRRWMWVARRRGDLGLGGWGGAAVGEEGDGEGGGAEHRARDAEAERGPAAVAVLRLIIGDGRGAAGQLEHRCRVVRLDARRGLVDPAVDVAV